MKKPITPAEIHNALQLALKYNFMLYALFIFGDTAETVESYSETLSYWKQHAEGQIRLGTVRLFPGSAIYRESVERGIIRDKLSFFENEMVSEDPLNFTEALSEDEYQIMLLEVADAKRRYIRHVVPHSVRPSDRYSVVDVTCPFCGKRSVHDRVLIGSHSRYCVEFVCASCLRRFTIMSRISWLWMHGKSLRYAVLKLLGLKRMWRFPVLFRGLTRGG